MTWIPDNLYQQILEVVPIVCVDVAIIRDNKILLIQRAQEPAKGEWWLPGGRLYKNESLEGCALRKAREEVGLCCAPGPLIHTQPTIFETVHSVNFCYLLYGNTDVVKPDDTVLQYEWVTLGGIKRELHPYIRNCILRIW